MRGLRSRARGYYGRSFAESPEIDGRVWVESVAPVKTGQFVTILVDGAVDGELRGSCVEEF